MNERASKTARDRKREEKTLNSISTGTKISTYTHEVMCNGNGKNIIIATTTTIIKHNMK